MTYGGDHLDFFDTPSDPIFLGLQILGVVGIIGTLVPLYAFRLALFDRARPWWDESDGWVHRACGSGDGLVRFPIIIS
ncbi:MAG: hypothetical protein WDM89_12290 [Rhizomicrobium sp.]